MPGDHIAEREVGLWRRHEAEVCMLVENAGTSASSAARNERIFMKSSPSRHCADRNSTVGLCAGGAKTPPQTFSLILGLFHPLTLS